MTKFQTISELEKENIYQAHKEIRRSEAKLKSARIKLLKQLHHQLQIELDGLLQKDTLTLDVDAEVADTDVARVVTEIKKIDGKLYIYFDDRFLNRHEKMSMCHLQNDNLIRVQEYLIYHYNFSKVLN